MICVQRACQRMDLHQRQQIWLPWVAYLPHNFTLRTISDGQIIVHKLLPTKTVHLGNTPINFIPCMCMVAHLHSSHFQVLCSCITTVHSTWQIVHTKTPVQAMNFQVLSHHCIDITSTKAGMAAVKWSPAHSVQDKRHHLQVHLECLHDCQQTILFVGKHLPALLHLNILPTSHYVVVEQFETVSRWMSPQRDNSC